MPSPLMTAAPDMAYPLLHTLGTTASRSVWPRQPRQIGVTIAGGTPTGIDCRGHSLHWTKLKPARTDCLEGSHQGFTSHPNMMHRVHKRPQEHGSEPAGNAESSTSTGCSTNAHSGALPMPHLPMADALQWCINNGCCCAPIHCNSTSCKLLGNKPLQHPQKCATCCLLTNTTYPSVGYVPKHPAQC